MSWLDSLDIPIADALARFPDNVRVAAVQPGGSQATETYLVAEKTLQNMLGMQLGQLPLSTIALPYDHSEMLRQNLHEHIIRNVSRHLCDYFPNFFVAAIYELQSLLAARGQKAYIIGGITRDMLLSVDKRFDVQDVDITIEGDAIIAAEFIVAQSKNFKLLQTYEAFGTAKLCYKDHIEFDLASTREERYPYCGALPDILARGVSLELDIVRRDFTINALALSISETGQVIDCATGLADLEAGRLRLIKASSFFEDPSRILRALMFAARLNFTVGPDFNHLLQQGFLPWMPQVYKGGGERIRDELTRFLSLPESDAKLRALIYFVENGLHRLIDSSLPQDIRLLMTLPDLSQRIQQLQQLWGEAYPESLSSQIYLTMMVLNLPWALIAPALNRFGSPRHEIDSIEKSLALYSGDNPIAQAHRSDAPVRLYETFYGLPQLTVAIGLLLSSKFENALAAYQWYQQTLAPISVEVTGEDILKLGVPQGALVGKLLKSLLYEKLQGTLPHRIDEMAWLREQLGLKTPEMARDYD